MADAKDAPRVDEMVGHWAVQRVAGLVGWRADEMVERKVAQLVVVKVGWRADTRAFGKACKTAAYSDQRSARRKVVLMADQLAGEMDWKWAAWLAAGTVGSRAPY